MEDSSLPVYCIIAETAFGWSQHSKKIIVSVIIRVVTKCTPIEVYIQGQTNDMRVCVCVCMLSPPFSPQEKIFNVYHLPS